MSTRVHKIIPAVLTFAMACIFLVTPMVTFAINPLVPENLCNVNINDTTHQFTPVECGFVQLVQVANNILNFMVYFSIPIAAIAFAWAGWLYLSAAGNSGQISKAHGIFLNVVLGLILVLTAWLIVDLILKQLVLEPSNKDAPIRLLNG